MQRQKFTERGFSYVEVLMAALMLGMFFVPVATGFAASARNIKFADTAYRAGLGANNLLQEAGRAVMPEHFESAPDLSILTSNSAFDIEYQTDEFDYALTAVELKPDGRVMYLATGEHYAGLPEFSGELMPERVQESLVLKYDGAFELLSGSGAVLAGDRCKLNIDGAGAEIHFESAERPVEIAVGGGVSSLMIYTADGVDRSLITVLNEGDADVSVSFLDKAQSEYLLLAEVYAKSGDILASMTLVSGGSER